MFLAWWTCAVALLLNACAQVPASLAWDTLRLSAFWARFLDLVVYCLRQSLTEIMICCDWLIDIQNNDWNIIKFCSQFKLYVQTVTNSSYFINTDNLNSQLLQICKGSSQFFAPLWASLRLICILFCIGYWAWLHLIDMYCICLGYEASAHMAGNLPVCCSHNSYHSLRLLHLILCTFSFCPLLSLFKEDFLYFVVDERIPV